MNMSLALNDHSTVARWALERAHAQGILLVASAGNGGTETNAHFPANLPEVIGVAAVDSQDRKAGFSSYGSTVGLSAPGLGIVSTYRFHGFASWSGTSMAAAIVSGAAALGFGAEPGATPDAVRGALEAAAVPMNHAGQPYEGLMGVGRLDVLGVVFQPIHSGS
jgi:subtilisin family serine protease